MLAIRLGFSEGQDTRNPIGNFDTFILNCLVLCEPTNIMNHYKNNKNTKPLTWQEIEKVKWKHYNTNNKQFDSLLDLSHFKKSPAINALQGIFNRSRGHFERSTIEKRNPFELCALHKNLYSLVISKDLLRISYNKLKANKGAMTPGTDNKTADSTSENVIEKLHLSLKNRTFKWNPVKRIDIQKPGRAPGVTRPLGLPDFTDKLVQNNIMLVLSAIYEPEFEFLDSSFGFRPKKSSNSAIKKIRLETRGMDFAIEGDIEGAYDNVQHNILIKILRKRIADEKFLELIYSALRAGFMKDITYYDTFLGTPQGGIHSPILFNIYMSEFDKFIKFQIPSLLNNWNQKKNYSNEATNSSRNLQRQISRRREYLSHNPKQLRGRQYIQAYKLINHLIPDTEKNKAIVERNIEIVENPLTEEEKAIQSRYDFERKHNRGKLTNFSANEQIVIKRMNALQGTATRMVTNIKDFIKKYDLQSQLEEAYADIARQEIGERKNEQLSTPALDPNKKILAYKYYRYADDWIFFLRGPKKSAEKLKKIFSIWLKNNLKLNLSPQKTLITNIRESKAHFLGFEIFYQINKQRVKRVFASGETALQRYGEIQIMPDADRMQKKFEIKNYIRKDGRIMSLGALTVLEDHQIIEKFNQAMVGIGLYYSAEISRMSALNHLHYILYFCCLKTLSHRHRSSIRKIVNELGHFDLSKPKHLRNQNEKKTSMSDFRIVSSYTLQDGTQKHQVLLNYNEFMMKMKKLREQFRDSDPTKSFNSPTIDFLILHKNNWRTKFMLNSMCGVCASTEKLEMHHINALRNRTNKEKKYSGFDQLVAALGRKQICLCQLCHNKVHRGEYDGLSLKDLVDLRIVAPEVLLRTHEMSENQLTKKLKNPPPNILVNKQNKTYHNPDLEFYYNNQDFFVQQSSSES